MMAPTSRWRREANASSRSCTDSGNKPSRFASCTALIMAADDRNDREWRGG